MREVPQKWIARLFYSSCGILLFTTLLVLIIYWEKQPDHQNKSIADITINLDGNPVREHCTTCHPDGSLPDKADLIRLHSDHPLILPHNIALLGCTSCHLGEGMALDNTISHGLPGNGARKVLAGKDIQASCYTCHELAPLSGADMAWSGYKLFKEKACDTCHRISKTDSGTRFGPGLSQIGSYLGIDLLQDAIRNPAEGLPASTMPRFPLSKKQARKIAYFLKSRVQNPLHISAFKKLSGGSRLPIIDLAANRPGISKGEKLLFNLQCLGCHQYRDVDGRIATDLSYIGQLRDRAYLKKFITHPTSLIPGAKMPAMQLSSSEENLLLSFLAETSFSIESYSHLPRQTDTKEKHLYMILCQRCHAAAGDGRGPIQPNLSGFPRAFLDNKEFFRRISNDRILKSITKGIPGTSMPPYESILSREQATKMIELVFVAFVGAAPNDKVDLPPLPAKPARPISNEIAKSLFEETCSRCHGRAGIGKGPEYLEHLPRPRNLTNYHYFSERTDEELARAISDGIPGTDMPSFRKRLDASQIWGLISMVKSLAGTVK